MNQPTKQVQPNQSNMEIHEPTQPINQRNQSIFDHSMKYPYYKQSSKLEWIKLGSNIQMITRRRLAPLRIQPFYLTLQDGNTVQDKNKWVKEIISKFFKQLNSVLNQKWRSREQLRQRSQWPRGLIYRAMTSSVGYLDWLLPFIALW